MSMCFGGVALRGGDRARSQFALRAAAIAVAAGGLVSITTPALAQMSQKQPAPSQPQHCRSVEDGVPLSSYGSLRVTHRGFGHPHNPGSPWTDDCTRISNYTAWDFQSSGSFIGEFGMAQGEMAAVSYQLTAADFPLKIDSADILFVTNGTTVTTTTKWSVFIWAGPPNTGALVDSESSDGDIIPDLVIPPGTNGTVLDFSIDPTDPDQIIVQDNGSHILSVGFRIDHHNNQTQDPCSTAPPMNSNAFPAVDADGLAQAPNNWLNGINCGLGPFNCPPTTFGNNAPTVWGSFSQMGSGCRPSGDWVMRATWESVNCSPGVGACCNADGSCTLSTSSACTSASGAYQGDGTACATVNCPQPTGACCFSNNSCLARTQASCTSLGGTWLGGGTTCSGSSCPTGACCFADGTCQALTSSACVAQGGTFHGTGVSCANANCPQPTGACCTSGGCDLLSHTDCTTIGGNWLGIGTTCTACTPTGACCTAGGCDLLTQSDCTTIGGTWHGAGSNCSVCTSPSCYANCDASTQAPLLNVADFTCFLQKYAAGCGAPEGCYPNCDGSTSAPFLNVADFTCFLQKFAGGCP